jgi:hypothetical protein
VKLPETQEFIEKIKTAFQSEISIVEVNFQYDPYRQVQSHSFKLKFSSENFSFEGVSSKGQQIGLGSMIDRECDQILKAVWGTKRCPTYFCKKDKVYFSSEVSSALSAFQRDSGVHEKVQAFCEAYRQTDDFLNLASGAMTNTVKNSIITALKQFKDVDRETFVEAFDEFLTSRVIDS